MLLVGVDGGGTRTTCLVADRDGHVRGAGEAGAANYLAAGAGPALVNIGAALAAALAAAGGTAEQVGAACFGLAGVARPEDQAAMYPGVAALVPGARVALTHDAAIALAGATGGAPGCVVIAGTGAIAYGEDAAGRTARAGGWGWFLDDAGSGFDLGRRALTAVLHAHDGRGPATALAGPVLARLGARSPDELVGRIHRPVGAECLPVPDLAAGPGCGGWHPHLPPRPQIAALAELVLDLAGSDPVARSLLHQAGADLAAQALAVLHRLDLDAGDVPVATAGGLFRGAGGALGVALAAALAPRAPGARVVAPAADAAHGALLLARRLRLAN